MEENRKNRLQILFDAVENNEVDLVNDIVDIAACEEIFLDINAPIPHGEMAGMTALALATQFAAQKIVLTLLKIPNIDVNVPDKEGRSPLIIAIETDQEELVARLLHVPNIDVNFADNVANTPLSKAVENGNTQIVHMLLHHHQIDVNMSDYADRSPLDIAYTHKKMECLFKLLTHDALSLDIVDSDGVPFLNRLCLSEKSDVVARICACPSVTYTQVDQNGDTCVHNACANIYHDIDVLNVVLKQRRGLDVNITNNDGETPLFWATHHNRDDAVAELLRAPDIDVNVPNPSGETPLHRAISSPKILKKLLCAPGIEVNARTMQGETALFLAASRGRVEAIKILLRHPFIDLNIYSDNGELTPVAVACENGNENSVYELIGAGADVHRPNREGMSPVALAAERGHTEIVDYFVNRGLVLLEDIPELVQKAQSRYYDTLVMDFEHKMEMQNEIHGPGSSDASAYDQSFGSNSEAGPHSGYFTSELDMEEKREIESIHSCDCCRQEDDEKHGELEIEYLIEFYFCDDNPRRHRNPRFGRARSDSVLGDPCAPGSMLVRAQYDSDECDSDSDSREEGQRNLADPEPRPPLAPLKKSLSILRSFIKPHRAAPVASLELVSNKLEAIEEKLQHLPSLRSLSSQLTSSLSFWRSDSRDMDLDDGKERAESDDDLSDQCFQSPPRAFSDPISTMSTRRARPSIILFPPNPKPPNSEEPKMGFFEPITPGSDFTGTPRMEPAGSVTPGQIFPIADEHMDAFRLDDLQAPDNADESVFTSSLHNSSCGSLSPTTCLGHETFGDEDVVFDEDSDATCRNLTRFCNRPGLWDNDDDGYESERENEVFPHLMGRPRRGAVLQSGEEDVGEPIIVMNEPLVTVGGEAVEDAVTPM